MERLELSDERMTSIVIIEYNSLEDVDGFVASLASSYPSPSQVDDGREPSIELIVSSNSMYDEVRQKQLCVQYPTVKWVFNEKNGGFAYGMNEGLKAAQGDTLVVANADVKLRQSLQPMTSYLWNHKEIGIIGPKIVDDQDIIQDSFRHFFSPWGFFKRQVGWIKNRGKLHEKNFTTPVSGDWIIGAFMMVRRDFYEKVGGLSEDYFMYCEDMDWCRRAHLSGYEVVYFPEVVVEYKGTRSSRKRLKYTKIHIQSLLTFWRKYGFHT